MANYRDQIIEDVSVPLTGVRRIQSGLTTLTSTTTTIPVNNFLSPATKVYALSSVFDSDATVGAEGYTLEVKHSQNELEVVMTSTPSSGTKISWQVLEIY